MSKEQMVGFLPLFQVQMRPAVEAVVFGWLRALLVSDGIVDRPGALSG